MEAYINDNIDKSIEKIMYELIMRSENNVIFGGSIALNLIGLVRRPVKDIDIVLVKRFSIKTYGLEDIFKHNAYQSSDEYGFYNDDGYEDQELPGNTVQRAKLRWKGVDICAFNQEAADYSEFPYYFREYNKTITLKINNINEIFMAKLLFAQYDQPIGITDIFNKINKLPDESPEVSYDEFLSLHIERIDKIEKGREKHKKDIETMQDMVDLLF